MNFRFIARALGVALPLVVLASFAWIWFESPLGLQSEPTPPPPTIYASPGEMPARSAGLRVWARYRGEAYAPVASGFFLSLRGDQVVAVTTAHSLLLHDPDRALEEIALGIEGEAGFVGRYDTLRCPPGRARTGEDMTVDYVLLHVTGPVETRFRLLPDVRGMPQPGERVSLYSGVADRTDEAGAWEGTVQSVSDVAVWVLMDSWFDPYGMSGSPLVSQHTGRVVGMAVAMSPRRNRVLLGVHPIGSLVHLAETAAEYPRLGE